MQPSNAKQKLERYFVTLVHLPRIDHIRDLRLQNLALLLERLDGLEEQLVTIPLTGALDGEDKVVSPSPKLDLALELGVPQDLAADGVAHRIFNYGLQLALVTVVPAALFSRILSRHMLEPNHARHEAVGELVGVLTYDRLGDGDGGH